MIQDHVPRDNEFFKRSKIASANEIHHEILRSIPPPAARLKVEFQITVSNLRLLKPIRPVQPSTYLSTLQSSWVVCAW